MHSSEADEHPGWGLEELKLLAALGFGPESALMNEPKLFVDGAFLAALQQELVAELGEEETARTLFYIGAIHGLRDAARIGDLEPGNPSQPQVVETPPLAMHLGAGGHDGDPLAMAGCWPDHFEAEARLNRLGAADRPTCLLSAGYTSGWLSGTLDRDIVVEERCCRAAGDEDCSFVARDEHDATADTALPPRLSMTALRGVALAPPASASLATVAPPGMTPAPLPSHIDPDDPAVHIWGPVMVMPFADPDAAMQTTEMLSRDEATRGVRVVVLDLAGGVLDDGMGAAALEHVAAELQSWGAEVILTGISPFSEEVVAQLQASLMLTRKDLSEAIAYAFQIADAQRRLL